MRPEFNNQPQLNFQPCGSLEITNAYYAKYAAIDQLLGQHPELVHPLHRDIAEPLECEKGEDDSQPASFKCASETVLRLLICMCIEDLSLRQVVVRVDDSNYLRQFVRIYNDSMIDFSTLCRLRGAVSPATWEEINRLLGRAALQAGQLSGASLRLDTTVVETNIHWPTDSGLLWDTYRVLARLVKRLRELVPAAVGKRRLHLRKVKHLQQKIARVGKGRAAAVALKRLYLQLIARVRSLLDWCPDLSAAVQRQLQAGRTTAPAAALLGQLLEQVQHYHALGQRVVEQSWRRVIQEQAVPNAQKLFSLFEPHTELIKRGKAGKPIEFGHKIQIQQVASKFITGYDVFPSQPAEPKLLTPALRKHKQLFGRYPQTLTADKGYYESMEDLARLGQKISVVAIGKKGKRSPRQAAWEADPLFRHAQCFRAGIEGSISFLKRVLGLARCYLKGWEHYAAAVGATVFVHNLLILTRR
jgi:IS5 family transposase